MRLRSLWGSFVKGVVESGRVIGVPMGGTWSFLEVRDEHLIKELHTGSFSDVSAAKTLYT